MRVVLSERVEAELAHHFTYGVEKFGRLVAVRTFCRVRRFFLESLAAFPRIGVYRSGRDVYEVVIPRTPFIAFYRIDAAADLLTVVAFFHYAQDRKSEWGGDNGRGSCKGVPPA
jgi:plasmid stabilization system protein ParE